MPTNEQIFNQNHVQRNTRAPAELRICDRDSGTSLSKEPTYLFRTVQAADVAGAFLYLKSDGSYATCDPSDPTKMPAVAYLEEKLSSTSGALRPLGEIGEVSVAGLTDATAYVVGSDGLPAKLGGSNYPTAGSVIQQVGFSLSTSVLLLVPGIASGVGNGDLDYVNTAAGTVLTNSTTETTLLSYTIPANTLRARSVIEIDYAGLIVSAQSTDTFLPKLYIGATAITGHAALNSTTNDIFTGNAKVAVRSTTSVFPVGNSLHGPPASATPLPLTHAAVTIDATAAIVIALKGTWSVAHADNQARGDILRVRVRR